MKYVPVPTRIKDVPITRLETFAKRFTIMPNGCWEWKGRIDARGYGMFSVYGANRLAHRVMWELVGQPVDSAKELHHECNNTVCVNPKHLRQVTSLENNQAKVNRPFCKRGHLWSENTVPYNSGDGNVNRRCRSCVRIRATKYRRLTRNS